MQWVHDVRSYQKQKRFSNVNLEYSIDGGVGWNTIIKNTPNDGIYSWVVPEFSSSTVKIKLSDPSGEVEDISDGNFEIKDPSAALDIISKSDFFEILILGRGLVYKSHLKSVNYVTLFDLSGSKLFSEKVNSNQFVLNPGTFEKGVYLVEFKGDEGIERAKLTNWWFLILIEGWLILSDW